MTHAEKMTHGKIPPVGNEDSKRRKKWIEKAVKKQQHIDAHKQRQKEADDNKPFQADLPLRPKDKQDKNALAFQKLKEVINDGQRALGAFNPEIKIMPDLAPKENPKEKPKSEDEHEPVNPKEEEKEPELPKEEAVEKKSFLTKSRQKALAFWNTCKMHKRKDQLTRLLICAVCILVIIFALVAMSILSWFSHGNTTTNAPPLPHTILF